jgi:amino acid adenylation domain-containing protein
MESFQISPQQERLWVAEPEGPTARVQALLTIDGELDADALEQGLRAAVERHESLRTTFVAQPGLTFPAQVVHPSLGPAIQTIATSGAERSERLRETSRSELREPLNLEQGPLVRAIVLIENGYVRGLVLTVSALCADPASLAQLLGELSQMLAGAQLSENPLQYADFSAWQHELAAAKDEEAETARAFWRELDALRSPELPFTRTDSAGETVEHVDADLDAELIEGLRRHAARYGVPVQAFVQAAWHAALGRFGAAETATVAFLAGERRHADLEGAIGAFVRPVPLAIDVAPGRSFAEVAADVARARTEALVRQDYGPTERHEVVQIGFADYSVDMAEPSGASLRIERLVRRESDLPLLASCVSDGERLRLGVAFDPTRYRRETVASVVSGVAQILRAASSDPSVAIGATELLAGEERERVLEGLNDTVASIPNECVHETISGWARSAPQRTAVTDGESSLDYAELNARANGLARRLRALGVGPGGSVGLCTDRSIEMVVGLLGILKAGAAYVPLHHEHPSARLRDQLERAGATALVTQERLHEKLAQFEGDVVCLDGERANLDALPSEDLSSGITHEDPAYVIYTSGSTGTPKGVCVTHGNLANYAAYIVDRLGAGAEALSFGLVTSISTDLGNTSVLGALCSGGTLVLVAPEKASDPGALAALMETTPIDVLKITPSHLGALMAGGDARLLPRKTLVLGGERTGWDLVERVRALSDCEVFNHYGPTETTIGSCTYLVGEGSGEGLPASVPVGGPIANTRCYVLDASDRPLPVGVPGKLFIAGAGVARGYIGEDELTAERFVPDPFAAGGEARMYDTGDLARWLPDGTLEFLGRVDEQVKLRGYRVEPAEVETALRAHRAVREAIAVVQRPEAGEPRLVAYCTLMAAADPEQLSAHLAEWLPEYMMPSSIVVLEELPRTPSGKIDRLALPDPDLAAAQSSEYVAPRTPVEQAVAEIWAQVLGLPKVGVEDDFFALGGHSLLATQVVAQVRSDFAVELPLHSLFTCPTVTTLASEIVSMMGDSEGDETTRLMAELEGMSDEEARRLLADDMPPQPRPG